MIGPLPESSDTGPAKGVPAPDYLLPELAQLLATAKQQITEHDNGHGLCSVCGSAFPCERAELAALALEAP